MRMRIGANYKIASAVAIASTATVYTNSFRIGFADVFGASFLASSASSTPDLKIELEQGDNVPTSEGSSDTNYVVADGVGDIYTNLTSEVTKRKAIVPVPSQYGRFKITGNASNPADTVITINLFLQELA